MYKKGELIIVSPHPTFTLLNLEIESVDSESEVGRVCMSDSARASCTSTRKSCCCNAFMFVYVIVIVIGG